MCVYVCVYMYTRAQSERDELKRERDELETKVCVTERKREERGGGGGGLHCTSDQIIYIFIWC